MERLVPNIYGGLVNSHRGLFLAYLVGAGVMVVGGLAEVFLGVDAERKLSKMWRRRCPRWIRMISTSAGHASSGLCAKRHD